MSESSDPQTTVLEIIAEEIYLETVAKFIENTLESAVFPDDAEMKIFSVKLSIHEACVNIIEHAYKGLPGPIRLEVTLDRISKKVQLDLYDQGAPAHLDEINPPNLDKPQIKGYGLFLMQQLMDSVDYFHESGTNHWRLVKQL